MKTRSNGARPSTDETTCRGTHTSSSPAREMSRPSSLRRRARAVFTSSNVTSSPARVSCAPTRPPNAPAPRISIRICVCLQPLRGSAIPPDWCPLLEEGRDPFAHVFSFHEVLEEHSLSLEARLLEWAIHQLSRCLLY